MKKIPIITLLLIALTTVPCLATSYYVKDGGSSSACTTWTDACDQISTAEGLAARGDTIYVADGTYTGAILDTATSGTTPITIKKSTVADHGTETGYSEADHDGVATFTSKFTFSTGFWIFDGVTGGGPAAWTTGHGFVLAFEAGVSGESTNPMMHINSNDITIAHVDFNNTYNAAHCSRGISGYSQTNPNVTIKYCYFRHFFGTAITVGYNGDGWTFEYNYFDEITSSSYTPACHGNYIANLGTDELTVRYNVFKDCQGTSCISAMNGDSVSYTSDPSLAENWYIHGNVFLGSVDGVSRAINLNDGNGTTSRQSAKNWKIYNNNFINLTVPSLFNKVYPLWIEYDGTGNEFKNNIVFNCESPGLYSLNGTILHDYNWTTGAAFSGDGGHSDANNAVSPFTDWEAGDYTLVAALAGDSSIGATYNKDWTTATRGGDAVWDMGALEYAEGGAPPDTDTPDITTIVIDSTGTVLTITLDEDVTVVTGGGFTLACAAASGEGLAYVSESAGVLTFNITGVAIDDDDTCTLDYATIANDIQDAAGNDLETIGDPVAVDNQSTNTPEATSYTVSVSVGEGCSLSPAKHQTIKTGATASITCTPSVNYQCITWTGTCSGSGTTSWSATITGDCTATQPCQKIASDSTIGSGCAIKVGSGPAIKVY